MSTQTDTQFRLRLPTELHARVKAASESNLRSINAEIAHALEAAYPPASEPESVNLEMLEALKAHDAYMLAAGYSGPEDSALHPNAANNWRNAREAISKAEGL